jgi:8-oxo-dGTP pyrophosphatase MutT (NUDIX family)
MTTRDDRPHLSLVSPWTEGPESEIASTRIFSVTTARCTSTTRPELSFLAARLRCPDWVNVIALTEDRRMILIEQYRHGTREVTLEIPGGMVDAGETPEQACARELLEETGFAGEPVRVLGVTAPNPAFQNNRLTTGLVVNARKIREATGDGHEEIGVRLAHVDEVHELVRRGVISHALVVAAFHLFALSER